MKKILIPTIIAGAMLTTASVFAESLDTEVPKAPEISSVSVVTEKSERVSTNNLARLKAKGSQLIKERINALSSNGKAIDGSKLSVEQKAAINGVITTNKNGLTTLGASIASSTDATSTKVLIDKIYSDFRIYAIVIPQIRLEKRINELQNHIPKLNDTFAKIQAKIDAQKAKGKDVTVWQKSLDDAKALVVTDTTKLAGLYTQVSALKPADYGTSSKATIDAVNTGIKSVAKDFSSIAKTARAPRVLMNEKHDNKATSTATTTNNH
jgi:hypothetical protein